MKIGAIIDKSRLAKTDEEYLALHADNANTDWLARSAEDVQALRNAKAGPLGKLSEENYATFFNSLQFSKGGLATMDYSPLMAELTFKETNEVLNQFGMDATYAVDHDGFRCISVGTCQASQGFICTSNC